MGVNGIKSMIKVWVGLMVSLPLLLILYAQPIHAEDRSFEIGEVEIYARVDDSGNLHVTETDTYHFDGAFNGILVDLNTAGSDGIEQFQAFDLTGQQKVPLQFEKLGDGEKLQYKVYAQSADETKVFQLTYSLKNVVQVHADTAELYWKFFDQSNPSQLGTVRVDVELPGGVKQDDIFAFGHGPLYGDIEINHDGIVRYEVSPLPPAELLEVRILFPVSSVPNSTKVSEANKFEQILEEEENWKAGDSEYENEPSVYGALVLLIVNLTAGTLVYLKFGKTHRAEWKGKYYRELPGELTPAVVSYLMNYRVEAKDLMATLVDLTRKRRIDIHQAGKLGKAGQHPNFKFQLLDERTVGLMPHEALLIDWFFRQLGRGKIVYLSQIRKHAEGRGNSDQFRENWQQWQATVAQVFDGLVYAESNKKPRRLVILAAIAQIIGFWFLAPEDWSWLLFCGFPLLLFIPRRMRRTPQGQTEYAKWKAFRRYLRHYDKLAAHDPLAAELREHYFAYAIALGEGESMLAAPQLKIPAANRVMFDHHFFYNYAFWLESFDPPSQTSAASSNHSSGDSGSFSSGGGDGGGGGGRGAF